MGSTEKLINSELSSKVLNSIIENRELLIAYKTLSGFAPREYEKILIANFLEINGRLPFANLVH